MTNAIDCCHHPTVTPSPTYPDPVPRPAITGLDAPGVTCHRSCMVRSPGRRFDSVTGRRSAVFNIWVSRSSDCAATRLSDAGPARRPGHRCPSGVRLRARLGAARPNRPVLSGKVLRRPHAPSILAWDQSSTPAVFSSGGQRLVQLPPTPAWCQSRSRRQHVIPEPNPSSWAGTPTGSPCTARKGSRIGPCGHSAACGQDDQPAAGRPAAAARSGPTARPRRSTAAAAPSSRPGSTTHRNTTIPMRHFVRSSKAGKFQC